MSASMKVPKCPKCGSPVIPGDEVCGSCHTRLTWDLQGNVTVSGWQKVSDFGGYMTKFGVVLMVVAVGLAMMARGCM